MRSSTPVLIGIATAALIFITGCSEEMDPTTPITVKAADIDPDCTVSTPCYILDEHIWVIVDGGGAERPCTEIPGGCFPEEPEAPPIIWGIGAVGGSPVDPPGRLYSSSAPPSMSQSMDIAIMIREIEKCLGLQTGLQDVQFRMNDWNDGRTYGLWWPAENVVYITAEDGLIWEEQNGWDVLVNEEELYETLLHESVHVFFGNDNTDHCQEEEEEDFQTAMAECRDDAYARPPEPNPC